MPAYATPLVAHSCQVERCKRRATASVYSTFNCFEGYFCDEHASQKVDALNG